MSTLCCVSVINYYMSCLILVLVSKVFRLIHVDFYYKKGREKALMSTRHSAMRPRRLSLRRLDGAELATPALLTATRAGAVPNLSRDSLDLISKDERVKEGFLLPFNYLVKSTKILQKFDKGRQKSVFLKIFSSWLTVLLYLNLLLY